MLGGKRDFARRKDYKSVSNRATCASLQRRATAVQSEKMLELVMAGSRVVRAGDLFGIGRQ